MTPKAKISVVDTVYRLDRSSIDFMVKQMVSDRIILSESIDHVLEDYFNFDERAYRIILKSIKILKSFFANEDFTKESIGVVISDNDEVRSSILDGSSDLRDEILSIVNDAFAFTPEDIEKNRPMCRTILRRFLSERGISDKLYNQIISSAKTHSVIGDPEELLNTYQNTFTSIQSLQTSAMCEIMPAGWAPTVKMGDPLGIPFIDQFVTGGVSPGETFGIIGGFGSGKTWMGIQFLANFCVSEHAKKLKCLRDGVPYKQKVAIYANYEGNTDTIRYRLMAMLAKMPTNTVKDFLSQRVALSTSSNLNEYEMKRYARVVNDELRLPEAVRYINALEMANTYARILDMSGSGNTGLGSGYIPEMVSQIHKFVNSTNHDIGLVVTDYAKLIADRHLYHKGIDMVHLRHYIKRIPEMLSIQVGMKYNCTVVILHQLSGAANDIKPGKPLHHSDSAESKDFVENLHRNFMIGAVHPTFGVQRFQATKLRDDERPSIMHSVIRLDRDSSSFVSDSDYVIDEYDGFAPASVARRGLGAPGSGEDPFR